MSLWCKKAPTTNSFSCRADYKLDSPDLLRACKFMFMKNKIALLLMCFITAACQEYPQTGEQDGNNKACVGDASYSSTIAVQVSGSIPSRLTASVNGMAVVNECTIGSDTEGYTIVRTGNGVTILLRVGKNVAMNDMFFDSNGRPKNTQFQFILRGSDSCGAGMTLFQTTRPLSWQPVYTNANKSCGPSGYSAVVSN